MQAVACAEKLHPQQEVGKRAEMQNQLVCVRVALMSGHVVEVKRIVCTNDHQSYATWSTLSEILLAG